MLKYVLEIMLCWSKYSDILAVKSYLFVIVKENTRMWDKRFRKTIYSENFAYQFYLKSRDWKKVQNLYIFASEQKLYHITVTLDILITRAKFDWRPVILFLFGGEILQKNTAKFLRIPVSLTKRLLDETWSNRIMI